MRVCVCWGVCVRVYVARRAWGGRACVRVRVRVWDVCVCVRVEGHRVRAASDEPARRDREGQLRQVVVQVVVQPKR